MKKLIKRSRNLLRDCEKRQVSVFFCPKSGVGIAAPIKKGRRHNGLVYNPVKASSPCTFSF